MVAIALSGLDRNHPFNHYS